MGFTTPTPIQAAAIPPALLGRDVLGTAQTGTGKTAAFGIPMVNTLLGNPRGSALVLLPTRELAVQVMDTLIQLLGDSRMATALLIGGESMPKQFQQLKMRPRVIVGTPGRINDHLQRGTLVLHDTRFLVLDETDRMLDMGFHTQLEAIARYLTAQRQTLMFSATLPDNILKLADRYLTNPVRVSIGSTTATATKVTQEHINVTDEEKFPRLLKELQERQGTVLVFVKTKWGAEKLAEKLCKQRLRADALHGDLRQSQRERVIDGFREQKFRILVATDIAARGLDIPHIEHVINYDLPQCPEDYIHRIGRTARAGAEGAAVNLLAPKDSDKWRAIQRMLDPQAVHAPRPVAGGKPSGGSRRRNRRPQHWQQKRSIECYVA
ncbi:MAG: DEAD/DEAH box helicase [Pseudomonadota bacterium]|nr:DEAD/DEAH box helicase [Pseudomonadota bacterium]MDE3038873.1 DEAD/DEAH box helicase [Pseudomonadota bacterium]